MWETKSGILLIKVFKLQLRCLIIWSFWSRINGAAQLPSAGDSDAAWCVRVCVRIQVCVCLKVLLERQSQAEEREQASLPPLL